MLLKAFFSRNSTPARREEEEECDYSVFLLRVWILPHKDRHLANLEVVALPVKDIGDVVDSHLAKGTGGYPSLSVDNSMMATVGPRVKLPTGSFGAPMVPILIDNAEDDFNTMELLTMLRAIWSRTNKPFLVSVEDWYKLTLTAPVACRKIKADARWPDLVPGEEDSAEGQFWLILNRLFPSWQAGIGQIGYFQGAWNV